ncbi:alkaline phosphatase [Lascolabacillus massiliensis]|uniref:alkaline phosphatase n=1 Tax=Lascolabacillus massiliensis TaxID=1627894 RepID=UPI0006B35F59|nr:alkaline phosphatase [Lascolabacillus massiliensis]
MKVKLFTSLFVLLLYIGTTFGQQKVFEGKESTYKNDQFHKVETYSHKFKSKRPKNVIVMIGDGMGVAQLFAGATANKGKLNLDNFKHVGFSRTQSANRYVTDSGAGGTAIAIGRKTNNSSVGVDADGNPVPSVLKIAQQNGLATGVVVTTSILDATPADFVAHVPKRDMMPEIASQFVTSGLDVFIGGGIEHFTDREDQRNLLEELSQKGYQVYDNIEAIKSVKEGKLAGFLKENRVSERGNQLEETTEVTLNILDDHKKGFFLMVEASEIDGGGHENDIQYTIEEMLDFDRTIGKVLEFAEKDGRTLVIVTADHETGGLTLTGGDMQTGEVTGRFTTRGHTGVMVPVFAYGPGAENFTGINENTSFYSKILNVLRLKE